MNTYNKKSYTVYLPTLPRQLHTVKPVRHTLNKGIQEQWEGTDWVVYRIATLNEVKIIYHGYTRPSEQVYLR